MIAKLADPRKITDAVAQTLVKQAKPIYWATGGMHSGETGSVEMLMELAYRLVVDDSPFIKTIRDNSIVMITPILEVDGRDKYVDTAMLSRKDPKAPFATRLVYWGKYVSHDDNRDNIGLALNLSKYIMKVALDYHPQVMHDLHESASHLYISTGSGPYNAWLDPIVVDEWHQLAYNEVDGMTREGVPGVWTHAFYDGWAPNYAFYAANGHNAIGRFYETQGAGDGANRIITNAVDRQWYRPESARRRDGLVDPEQRQHAAERPPHGPELRGDEPRALPREFLPQEQAVRGQAEERGPLGLRFPRRRSAAGPGGQAPPPPPGPGRRDQQGDAGLQGQGRRIPGRKLHRPDGPALFAHGRHAPRQAVFQRQRSLALRRRGLDARARSSTSRPSASTIQASWPPRWRSSPAR